MVDAVSNSIDRVKEGAQLGASLSDCKSLFPGSVLEMIFVGDALFPGGNDYPGEQAGVISIPVRGPHETKRVIETMIACLSDHGQETLQS